MRKVIEILALFCAGAFAQNTFTDIRDGKEYNYVKIGTQIWMAQNLDYEAAGSKCYDNKAENCEDYGRLYDWATAMDFPGTSNKEKSLSRIRTSHQGVCPKGWHLPSNAEWQTLIDFAGGDKVAGSKLKAKTYWKENCKKTVGEVISNIANTDDYNFLALPGGYCRGDGKFYNVSYYGNWWCAAEHNNKDAYSCSMHYIKENAYMYHNNKSKSFSVRCVKD